MTETNEWQTMENDRHWVIKDKGEWQTVRNDNGIIFKDHMVSHMYPLRTSGSTVNEVPWMQRLMVVKWLL